MGLYSGGIIIERIFASEIWGAYFGKAYFWGVLIIIGILRYYLVQIMCLYIHYKKS